jgi:hypothetical protein
MVPQLPQGRFVSGPLNRTVSVNPIFPASKSGLSFDSLLLDINIESLDSNLVDFDLVDFDSVDLDSVDMSFHHFLTVSILRAVEMSTAETRAEMGTAGRTVC